MPRTDAQQALDPEGDQLTSKQRLFVNAYVLTGNAASSMIAAGYSERSGATTVSRLTRNPSVAQAITKELSLRLKRTRIDADWVIARLAVESQRVGPESQHTARVNALGLLGRHLDMFHEGRLKISGQVTHRADMTSLSDAQLAALIANGRSVLEAEEKVTVDGEVRELPEGQP
jgi:hypothetical protein